PSPTHPIQPIGFYNVVFDAPKNDGRVPECREIFDESINIQERTPELSPPLPSPKKLTAPRSPKPLALDAVKKRDAIPKPEPKKIMFKFLRPRRKGILRALHLRQQQEMAVAAAMKTRAFAAKSF
ncbi:hypothetical protein HDU67_004210, partial [Dinochytrium kinnereticum]